MNLYLDRLDIGSDGDVVSLERRCIPCIRHTVQVVQIADNSVAITAALRLGVEMGLGRGGRFPLRSQKGYVESLLRANLEE